MEDYRAADSMAEKVIRRLDNIVQDKYTLEDFSIIVSSSTNPDRNVSPVQYIASERCLGLESWCVTHIYTYAQAQILKLCKNVLRKPIADGVATLNMYLNAALLIQPEAQTFWNIKRDLYAFMDHAKEMHFTKLVLSHKPKSLKTYTQRTWLISHQNIDAAVLQQELLVNNKAVASCANNYHAWNHRIWCMENLLPEMLANTAIIKELSYSADFINKHVSDHSGFHYRQYVLGQFKQRYFYPTDELIQLTQFFNIGDCCRVINALVHEQYFHQLDPKLLAMCNQYVSLLLYELFDVCKQLNMRFAAHEAIWYHRRFIYYEIVQLLRNIYGIKNVRKKCLPFDSEMSEPDDNTSESDERDEATKTMEQSVFYKNLILYERDFLLVLRKKHVHDPCEIAFIKRHENWLRSILGVDLDEDIVVNNGEILFKV